MLFELASIKSPAQWKGSSVLTAWNEVKETRAPVFSELLKRPEHPGPQMLSVVESPYHFIRDLKQKGARADQLFHLELDPKEQRNVASENGSEVLRLKDSLERRQTSVIESEEVEIPVDDESLRQLETLGYAG